MCRPDALNRSNGNHILETPSALAAWSFNFQLARISLFVRAAQPRAGSFMVPDLD